MLAAIMAVVAWLVGAGATAPASGRAQAVEIAVVPRLAHVVVIVFENHERGAVLGAGSAPTFDRLAARFAEVTHDDAVAHPSLPNYLALVSGSTHGVTSDCTDCMQHGPTIGSQLTAAHRRWAAYAEGFPGAAGFAQKHVPFLYFPGGAAHVLALDRFDPAHLPAYSLVIPDLCHDMHDCSVETGDRWLRGFIAPLLSLADTAIFIVFDEGTSDAGGGGNVPLVIAGTAVRPHSSFTPPTSHYGVLRTTEALLGLAPLGRARTARLITGVWRRSG